MRVNLCVRLVAFVTRNHWQMKQQSETEQPAVVQKRKHLRRKPFRALSMLFINAFCVVCVTINSRKNGCYSDYLNEKKFPSSYFFPLVVVVLGSFFGVWIGTNNIIHIPAKSVGCAEEYHKHQTQPAHNAKFYFHLC